MKNERKRKKKWMNKKMRKTDERKNEMREKKEDRIYAKDKRMKSG